MGLGFGFLGCRGVLFRVQNLHLGSGSTQQCPNRPEVRLRDHDAQARSWARGWAQQALDNAKAKDEAGG